MGAKFSPPLTVGEESLLNFLIADDHHLFLEGLKYLIHCLHPDATIAEANNGCDALTLLTETPSLDLALVDLRLPGIDGFTLLRRLTAISSLTPALIISSSEDPEDIKRAFHLGASGFVSKSFTPEELQKAITTILSGGIYKPQSLASTGSTPLWAEQHKITHRQLEVLRLAKKGKPNNEIAGQLFITERTVKAHITALLNSFKAKSRTELVHKASQLGLD